MEHILLFLYCIGVLLAAYLYMPLGLRGKERSSFFYTESVTWLAMSALSWLSIIPIVIDFINIYHKNINDNENI